MRSGTTSSRRVIVGALALIVGVAGTIAISQQEFSERQWFWSALLIISMLPILGGVFLIVRSLSREHFTAMQKVLERWTWRVELVLRLMLVIMAASLAVFAVLAFLYDADPVIRVTILVSLVFMAAVAALLRDGQVALGLVAMQQRMRAAVISRWLDTIVLASGLVAPLIIAVELGIDGAAAILTLSIAVLGAHYQRARAFDRAVGELVVGFDAIRWAGHLALTSSGDIPPFYRAVRNLQLRLARRPRALAPPFRWFGLEALCIVADARAMGMDSAGLSFRGPMRQELAEVVHSMSEHDFVAGTAQVFDALLQQVDRSPLRSRAGGDLREVLSARALPQPRAGRARGQGRFRARVVSWRRRGAP